MSRITRLYDDFVRVLSYYILGVHKVGNANPGSFKPDNVIIQRYSYLYGRFIYDHKTNDYIARKFEAPCKSGSCSERGNHI